MTDRKPEPNPRKPGGKPGGGSTDRPKDPHDPMRKPVEAKGSEMGKGKQSDKSTRK
jgi:hypothetical protein